MSRSDEGIEKVIPGGEGVDEVGLEVELGPHL